jgi:hypothetical protein
VRDVVVEFGGLQLSIEVACLHIDCVLLGASWVKNEVSVFEIFILLRAEVRGLQPGSLSAAFLSLHLLPSIIFRLLSDRFAVLSTEHRKNPGSHRFSTVFIELSLHLAIVSQMYRFAVGPGVAFFVFHHFDDDVIDEVAPFEAAGRGVHFSDAALAAIFPASFVVTATLPEHLAVTLSFIVFEVSLIDCTVDPTVDTVALFFSFVILSLIDVAVGGLPHSTAVTQSIHKIALVEPSVFPEVLSITTFFAMFEVPLVEISSGIPFISFAMLQTFLEVAFVAISVRPKKHSETMGFALLPLSNIAVILSPTPGA